MEKRLFVVISLLVSLVIVLSACGGSKESPATTPPASSSTNPTSSMSPPSGGVNLNDLLDKGASIVSVKFDMQVLVNDQLTTTATVYQKDKKMRDEITEGSKKYILIFDGDTGTQFTYFPDQKLALKAALDASMMPLGYTEDPTAFLKYKSSIIGTETVDGKSCTVINYTVIGADDAKAWIWTDKGFPIKIEVPTIKGPAVVTYTNLDFSDIPDSTFQLPADVTVSSTS